LDRVSLEALGFSIIFSSGFFHSIESNLLDFTPLILALAFQGTSKDFAVFSPGANESKYQRD